MATVVERAFAKIPFFRTLEGHEPALYRTMVAEAQAAVEKGASSLELQHLIAGQMFALSNAALARASDTSVLRMAGALTDVLEQLSDKDPFLCAKYLFPAKYGVISGTRYVSEAVLHELMEALEAVLIESYENNPPTIDVTEAEDLVAEIVAQLGTDADYLDPGVLSGTEDYSKLCKAFRQLLTLLLRERPAAAGNALRYLYREAD